MGVVKRFDFNGLVVFHVEYVQPPDKQGSVVVFLHGMHIHQSKHNVSCKLIPRIDLHSSGMGDSDRRFVDVRHEEAPACFRADGY